MYVCWTTVILDNRHFSWIYRYYICNFWLIRPGQKSTKLHFWTNDSHRIKWKIWSKVNLTVHLNFKIRYSTKYTPPTHCVWSLKLVLGIYSKENLENRDTKSQQWISKPRWFSWFILISKNIVLTVRLTTYVRIEITSDLLNQSRKLCFFTSDEPKNWIFSISKFSLQKSLKLLNAPNKKMLLTIKICLN